MAQLLLVTIKTWISGRCSLRQFHRRFEAELLDQRLGDLHSVDCSTFAQVVAHHAQVDAVGNGVVLAHAPDKRVMGCLHIAADDLWCVVSVA